MRRAQRLMLACLLGSLAAFVVLAVDDWLQGPIFQADFVVNDAVSAWRAAGFPAHELGQFLSLIGDGRTVAACIVAAAAYMLWRRQVPLALWTVGIGLTQGWFVAALKEVFQRARPELLSELRHSYSFPSGHTFGATAGLGTAIILAAEVYRRTRGPQPHRIGPRALWSMALALWATLAVLTGFGRVLAQEHWLSDVAASWCLGLALGSGLLLALSRIAPADEPGPQAPPPKPPPP